MSQVRIFQISSEVNIGSVGRIAEQIGEQIQAQGWISKIAYGREGGHSSSELYKIGSTTDVYQHILWTRLTDRHGFASRASTRKLLKEIDTFNPHLIQLQHIHGYYIHIEELINYLVKKNIPVVWTFHDCWSFTGHCAHYEYNKCEKWKKHCHTCPKISEYPKSWWIDASEKNFNQKKNLFNQFKKLTIVPVSQWLGQETKQSFLQNHNIEVIQNGIDLDTFKPYPTNSTRLSYGWGNKFIILGVASPWSVRKGFKYFIELSHIIPSDYQIVLVGLDKNQIQHLPTNITGIGRTNNLKDLAEIYSAADVFFNPTLEDTFPTTNLEALACGTPVVTFRTGGSPEAISPETGFVIEKEDLQAAMTAFEIIKKTDREKNKIRCRERAEEKFNKKKNFARYIHLYKKILNLD